MLFDNSVLQSPIHSVVEQVKLLGLSADLPGDAMQCRRYRSRLAVSLTTSAKWSRTRKCAGIGSATTSLNIQGVREVLVK